jgi:hypothetical protein
MLCDFDEELDNSVESGAFVAHVSSESIVDLIGSMALATCLV